MDTDEKMTLARERYGLLFTALAPVVPQILGSAFNIWYNAAVIEPMLTSPTLKQRFFATVIIYNGFVFPIGIWLWLKRIRYFAPAFRQLSRGSTTEPAGAERRGREGPRELTSRAASQSIEPESLTQARRRLIHLPWFAAALSGAA